jgi:hypothetical protein
MLLLHESYPYVLLDRKAKKLRKETGNLQLRSALDTGKSTTQLLKFSIVRPLRMLLLSPIVFIISLYISVIYGYLYLLFTTFPRVFKDQYGFSSGSVGLTYLGTGIGCFIGLIFSMATVDRITVRLTKLNGGIAKPEYRFPVMIIGALLEPLGLFLYGWTAEKKLHWILPILGSGIFGLGQFAMVVSFCVLHLPDIWFNRRQMPATTYLVDAFTVYAASAAAASTVFRSLLGALLPLAGNAMYDALGLGWGTSVLGFIAVAFIPMPLILWRYGEKIREKFQREW